MSSPPRRLPPKKDVMIELLAKSGVFLHLDPRRDGVSVPPQFRKQPELVLQVGLNMAVPIRDLEVDDDGVSCTLSFNRSPFWCRMPWPSIFAIVSDEDRRGVVWPEDVPPESKLASTAAAPPAPQRPKLRAVGRDEVAPAPPPPPSQPREGDAPTGEGTCGVCSTRWVEDQESCPICGASRAEAFRPTGGPPPDDEDVAHRPAASALPASIAAVPASEPPGASERVAGERAADEAGPEAPRADDATGESSEKPKRQLPPYLRIVK